MANSSSSSSPLAAADLVQARIDEKRLFEARFLFHKVSGEIEPEQRLRLEQALADTIARAEHCFRRGRQLEEQQRYEEAAREYDRVVAIAIDYPAVEQARHRIEVVRKLGPLQVRTPASPEEEPGKDTAPVDGMPATEVKGGPGRRRRWLIPVFSLLVLSAGLVVLLLSGREDGSKSKAPGPETDPVSNHISGRAPAVSPATDSDALFPRTPFVAEKRRKEKMTGIVLPRAIAPPITGEATAPSGRDRSVAGKTPEKNVSVQQSDIMEQPLIKAAIPDQGQLVKVTVDNDTVPAAAERLETAQRTEVKKGETGAALVTKEHPSADAAKAGIYIVRAGDTLGSIARKVYGSSRHWQRLYELNRDHLSRPSALRIGQQLRTRDEVETPVDPDPVGE